MSLGPLMIGLRGLALDQDERRWLDSPAIGGVILFTRNFDSLDQLDELINEIRAVRSPHLLIAVDQEGGRVQRFRSPFHQLPPMRQLGHLFDEDCHKAVETAHAFGWLMAAELRARGIDLSFAPVVDVDRGLAPVIGDRALHQDAQTVGILAQSFVSGVSEAGMHACAKHFPTHAGATADSHLATAVDRRDYDALLDDLIPYQMLIERGLRSIMISHVVFPALDRQPASYSKWWIKTQLRRELGFDGAVISDDLTMAGAAGAGSMVARAEAALVAGCDLVLVCNEPEVIPEIIAVIESRIRPVSQHRLMRLRGETAMPWDELRASRRWRDAVMRVDELAAAPPLQLEG